MGRLKIGTHHIYVETYEGNLGNLGINRDTSHFLKYGLRTEKGQAK